MEMQDLAKCLQSARSADRTAGWGGRGMSTAVQGVFADLMAAERQRAGGAGDRGTESGGVDERAELLRQLADWDSDFYREMRAGLRQKLEEDDEERKKQAVIDALCGVIDSMNAPEHERPLMARSTASIAMAAGQYDTEEPERAQLELFLQRLYRLGIYVDLDATGGADDGAWKSLTQFLAEREAEDPIPAELI